MSDYLIVQEADDGTWYDDGETAVGIQKARAIAKELRPIRGYDAVIYRLEFVEAIEHQMPAPAEAPNEST